MDHTRLTGRLVRRTRRKPRYMASDLGICLPSNPEQWILMESNRGQCHASRRTRELLNNRGSLPSAPALASGRGHHGGWTSTLLIVSTQREDTQREELHELVDQLPEEQVAAALALLRARKSDDTRPWPPRWFGAVKGRRTDTAERAEEILRDGFGRSA
jgi:hypothetical protein